MAIDKKIYVDLFWLRGTGLIIPFPTGIVYSNQSGGLACKQPTYEGFLVPLITQSFPHELTLCPLNKEMLDYFTGSKWGGHCYGGIDNEDADYLDSLFQKYRETKILKVDREKLKESEEAWIHITIEQLESKKLPFRGIHAEKGILVCKNSD